MQEAISTSGNTGGAGEVLSVHFERFNAPAVPGRMFTLACRLERQSRSQLAKVMRMPLSTAIAIKRPGEDREGLDCTLGLGSRH